MHTRDVHGASGPWVWIVDLLTIVLLAGCGSATVTSTSGPTPTALGPPSATATAPFAATTPTAPATLTPASSAPAAPTPAATPTTSTMPPGTYVVVQPGDTLLGIARRFELTVAELIAANDPAGNWDRDWDVLVAGEQIRVWRELLSSPDGVLYGINYDIHFDAANWPVHSSRIAALGSDGRPKPGWPYLTTDRASKPVFGSDGSVYLAQAAGPEEDRTAGKLVALGPDGRVKAGWPYVVPGSLPYAEPGPGPVVSVPQPPRVAPDRSIYGTFYAGIYRVRPDGRATPGWPYLLPSGTAVATCCLGDIPGPAEGDVFAPIRMADGRFYLPRIDFRSGPGHPDMMCLLDDGNLCSGWPIRLPDGSSVGDVWIGERGAIDVTLVVGGFDRVAVGIRPDGTLVHEVEVGETLSGLADAFGVTVTALLAANPQISDPSLIRTGSLVTIPPGGAGS